MSAVQPILHHPVTGELIPFGKTHRGIEETFISAAALPSWMTSTGNYTFSSPQDSLGYGAISPPSAAAGQTGQFATAGLFNTSQFRGMALTVEGFRAFLPNNGAFDWGIGLDVSALSAGVTFRHRAGQPAAEFVLGGATPTIVPTTYSMQFETGNPTFPRSLTLLYARIENFVALMSAGSVIAIADTTGLVTQGNVRPRAFMTHQDALARHLRVSKFRLDLWA